MVVDLRAQGNAQDVLDMVFNALFILGLNQEQFKEKLTTVYGRQVWPDFDVLSGELHMYAESTERMKAIQKEHNDGKVSAFALTPALMQAGEPNRGCWTCGGIDHIKRDCPKAGVIRDHRCSKCCRQGHLEKFCRGEGSDGRSSATGKKSSVKTTTYGKKSVPSNKSARTQKVLKEALARLITMDADEDEDTPQNDRETELDVDDDDGASEDPDDVFFTGCATCALEDNQDLDPPMLVQALLSRSRRLIIDSGCRGAHVVSSEGLVQKTVDTSSWKRLPVVRGISGHQIKTTEVGTLPGLDGLALVTPDAEESLLSLMELVKHNGGNFSGNSQKLTVTDGHGNTVLVATNTGDDFWSCSETELS